MKRNGGKQKALRNITNLNNADADDEMEEMDWEESVPDIDTTEDPVMSGEYCKEIFRNEKKREVKWIMPQRFAPGSKKSRMRIVSVDWLIQICMTWNLATDTVFAAVLYFEKVIRKVGAGPEEMQILAGTCLLIAAKMEEVHAVPIEDIVHIIPDSDHNGIKACEKRVLEALDYEMTTPHLMLFLRRYNTTSGSDQVTHNISKYLAYLSLRYQGHCVSVQSLLAAAICFLSRRFSGIPEAEAWSKIQTQYSGYTVEDIKPTAYFVCHVLSRANRAAAVGSVKTPHPYKVYSRSKYNKVSVRSSMRAQFVEAYSFLNTITMENE